jgi:hypothetical protein
MPKYPSECTGSGGQILNFQNTLDRACDEIRMEIQTENSFQNLIPSKTFNEIKSDDRY